MVRLYTTYDPVGLDPSTNRVEKLVTNALVTLNDDASTYMLRNTLLSHVDTSSYQTPMSAYVTNALAVQGSIGPSRVILHGGSGLRALCFSFCRPSTTCLRTTTRPMHFSIEGRSGPISRTTPPSGEGLDSSAPL